MAFFPLIGWQSYEFIRESCFDLNFWWLAEPAGRGGMLASIWRLWTPASAGSSARPAIFLAFLVQPEIVVFENR